MEPKMISCCGTVCSDCPYYPEECGGCPEIKGRVFWTDFIGRTVCEIYDCCVENKKLLHCGLCSQFPCRRYDLNDPTKTEEENQADFDRQFSMLRRMAAEGAEYTKRD